MGAREGGLPAGLAGCTPGSLALCLASAAHASPSRELEGCCRITSFPLRPAPPPQANEQCGQPWLLSGNYCRATCGLCTPGGAPAATAPAPEPAASPPNAALCSDTPPPASQASCAQLKVLGYCSKLAGGGTAHPAASAAAWRCRTTPASTAAAQTTPLPARPPALSKRRGASATSAWLQANRYCAATCGRCALESEASSAAPAAPRAESAAPAAPAPAADGAAAAWIPGCSDVPPPETDMSCAEQKVYANATAGGCLQATTALPPAAAAAWEATVQQLRQLRPPPPPLNLQPLVPQLPNQQLPPARPSPSPQHQPHSLPALMCHRLRPT